MNGQAEPGILYLNFVGRVADFVARYWTSWGFAHKTCCKRLRSELCRNLSIAILSSARPRRDEWVAAVAAVKRAQSSKKLRCPPSMKAGAGKTPVQS